jgi:membrane protein required for colicin V production
LQIIRILVIGILVWFFIVGLRRGLIRQVLEVVGIITAFIVSFYTAHALAEWIESRIATDYRISLVASAVLIFAGIIVLFHFIGVVLQKLFNLTILGAFDRVMGGVFGALKAMLIVSLALVIVLTLPFPEKVKTEIKEDEVTGIVYPVLPVMFDLVVTHLPGGESFEAVARLSSSETVEKAKKKAEEIQKKLEESVD